jgi:hypothetical protein
MQVESFRSICVAFNEANVRFMVAGGLAVNVYGFLRFTKNADLCIDLLPENIIGLYLALESLGYRPTIPISKEQFADASNRALWIAEKNMTVLQFWSDQHPQTPVGVFVDLPFVFSEEMERATKKHLGGVGVVHFVSLATLLEMKRAAGRAVDEIDVRELERIQKEARSIHQ